MPITIQHNLNLSYTFFVGQQLTVVSIATGSGIIQHSVDFSDASGRYQGEPGFASSNFRAQSGFPVLATTSTYSEISRYVVFLTTGSFKLRAKATESALDTGWVFSAEGNITVLPKGVFPASLPNPDQGSDAAVTARATRTQFDDGYEQRVVTGLNNIAETYTARWGKLDLAVAQTLINFFEAHRGVDWFYWTPPNAIQRKKWKVSSWKRSDEEGGKVSISAPMEQCFDL